MSTGKVIAAGGVFGGIVGLGLLMWRAFTPPDREIKPEAEVAYDAAPPVPQPAVGKTGWKGVDALMPKLQQIAQSTGIPLGLMVGWIGKESAGRISSKTSLDERGYFQLMPEESKSIGVEHERLSTDPDYSLDAGVKIIRRYQSAVNNLDLASAPAGSSFYWRLVKLAHSMGSGQTKKVVSAAKDAGQAGSWDQLEQFALNMKLNGPQPKKWFPFVDSICKVGRPFGFGSESTVPMAVVGAPRWMIEEMQGTLDGLNCLGAEMI